MAKPGPQNNLFSALYTHTGVQRLIHWIMDTQGIGQFELSKRADLSPAAIYQILQKSESQVTRPPRKSTLASLAKVVSAKVTFHSDKGTFAICQEFELPKTESREISLLLSEIGSVVMTHKKRLTKQERDTIVRVVKSLLDL